LKTFTLLHFVLAIPPRQWGSSLRSPDPSWIQAVLLLKGREGECAQFCIQIWGIEALIIEDIASQNSEVFETEKCRSDKIYGVHVSPSSAETCIMRGGITNHHLIAYSLRNISAKNYDNQLMCV